MTGARPDGSMPNGDAQMHGSGQKTRVSASQAKTDTEVPQAQPYRLRGRFLSGLDAVPLTTKLVACTIVLLMVGTVGISLTIRQLVGDYLIDRMDEQLRDQAPLVYSNVDYLSSRDSSEANIGFNDYFMQFRDVDNRIISTPLVPVLRNSVVSEPVLPASGSSDGVELGQPFTTAAKVRTVGNASGADKRTIAMANAPWRVLALEGKERSPDGTSVTKLIVYIGVSMGDQIDLIQKLTQYSVFVSIIIVVLGGIVATFIIRRTLLPLKRIEKTAAKIAAGDLSQRVPSAPENTEVGSLAASLNAMLARIESSFQEQEETTEKMKRFVSDASHELRTPLATIHGYSELYTMQRDMPGALERADESIAHIGESSSRMTLLVEDLLSLARLDEGRGIDLTQEVNLRQLLVDASDDLHALDPERKIQLGRLAIAGAEDPRTPGQLMFVEGALPSVSLKGDTSRLRQVITNIVGNIHRYTPCDSPVEVALQVMSASISPQSLQRMPATTTSLHHFLEAVEVSRTAHMGMNYAVFSFIDHGPGVPEDRQSQIFERFYTADPSRARQKGGTGLGMSIAQSVVRAHHGFIVASSTEEAGGLTLTVILPIAPLEPHEADAVQDAAQMRGAKRGGHARRDEAGGRSHAGKEHADRPEGERNSGPDRAADHAD